MKPIKGNDTLPLQAQELAEGPGPFVLRISLGSSLVDYCTDLVLGGWSSAARARSQD